MRKIGNALGAVAFAAGLLFFGGVIFLAGRSTLSTWSEIGPWLAAVGVAWILAGPAMFLAGLWVLGSRGRHRIPLWVGGAAAVLAGTVLIGGVLTYVIPCSGPS